MKPKADSLRGSIKCIILQSDLPGQKREREKIPIGNIKNERYNTFTDSTDIKRIRRGCYGQRHPNRCGNLEQKNSLKETYCKAYPRINR